MRGGIFVLGCCFALIVLTPVVLFLLTYIFRQSCVLCGLPKPSVLTAAGVMLVNFVADAVAESVMTGIVRVSCAAAGLPRWEAAVITFFLALPIDLVISSGIHAGLMSIRFGKGIEVWFVQRFIYLVLAVVAGLVYALYLLLTNG